MTPRGESPGGVGGEPWGHGGGGQGRPLGLCLPPAQAQELGDGRVPARAPLQEAPPFHPPGCGRCQQGTEPAPPGGGLQPNLTLNLRELPQGRCSGSKEPPSTDACHPQLGSLAARAGERQSLTEQPGFRQPFRGGVCRGPGRAVGFGKGGSGQAELGWFCCPPSLLLQAGSDPEWRRAQKVRDGPAASHGHAPVSSVGGPPVRCQLQGC